MLGQTGFPLGVEVDLTSERMTVNAGDVQVADWMLDEIKIFFLPDGFHVKAEGEEIILNVIDDVGFAAEVGL